MWAVYSNHEVFTVTVCDSKMCRMLAFFTWCERFVQCNVPTVACCAGGVCGCWVYSDMLCWRGVWMLGLQ